MAANKVYISQNFLLIKIFELIQIFQIYPTKADETDANRPIDLMDLPAELQMDIFEHFNFTDLLSVSQAIP